MATPRVFALDPAMIEQIVEQLSEALVTRLLAQLREEGLGPQVSEPTAWLDAQEVAQRLGVSREWVYEHANELGAARIGSGPRPRLRFPPQILDPRPPTPASSPGDGRRAKRRPKPSGLIPIHPS
jgi:predicted DNA-binding transcriptional regulator AlpA